jgi:hypothetical protein
MNVEIRSRLSAADFIAEHSCRLSAEHYGVHLCYICGCAFNDLGEVFVQRPLHGIDKPGHVNKSQADGS